MLATLVLLSLSQLPADAPLAPPVAAARPAAVETTPNVVRGRAFIPTIVGGVMFLGGITALIIGEVQYKAAANDTALTPEELQAKQSNATTNIVGGTALILTGAAVLGVSVVLWLWEPQPAHPLVALVPLKDGAAVFASMVLP